MITRYLEQNPEIKAILLDLDNTVYPYDPCHAHALKKSHTALAQKHPLSYRRFQALYKAAQREVKKYTKTQAASHSRFLYFQNICEQLVGKTDLEATIKLEKTYWDAFMKKMRVDSKIAAMLSYAKKKKIKVAIITNLTAAIQFQKIKKLKIGSYISAIVSSEEAGVEKPSPEIFRLALRKIQAIPQETLIIGDSHEDDLAAAQKLGIKTMKDKRKK